jgi:hypothetical protein
MAQPFWIGRVSINEGCLLLIKKPPANKAGGETCQLAFVFSILLSQPKDLSFGLAGTSALRN